jgi:hypothetical protein
LEFLSQQLLQRGAQGEKIMFEMTTDPTTPGSPPPEPCTDDVLSGRLHVYVAFDWGEEIDLDRARELGAGVVLDMVRRPRTPASIAYRPPPLRFRLEPATIALPGLPGPANRTAEATLFDFAGVSLALQVPFQMSRAELRTLAAGLAEPAATRAVMESARAIVEPLFNQVQPAITRPDWRDNFWEEYFVFQFPPGPAVEPDDLLGRHPGWLAGLLRLENEELSRQEIDEALRYVLRYGLHDVFIPDWGAAVLVDREVECDETLQAIEFANLQLLEFRYVDTRLDEILAQAGRLLGRSAQSRLPFWRRHARALRLLGELKVEANGLFERAGNALKLVGDQYLARVYRLLATRFHLPAWEQDIRHKLEVLEGVYEVLSTQSSHFRAEFLEIIVVILITIEVLLAIYKH